MFLCRYSHKQHHILFTLRLWLIHSSLSPSLFLSLSFSWNTDPNDVVTKFWNFHWTQRCCLFVCEISTNWKIGDNNISGLRSSNPATSKRKLCIARTFFHFDRAISARISNDCFRYRFQGLPCLKANFQKAREWEILWLFSKRVLRYIVCSYFFLCVLAF